MDNQSIRYLCEENGRCYLMADIKTPAERSKNMSKIRDRDTKPELWFRKQLFACGYRYRKNANTIPGHPDLWLPKYNTAIFVHGCFWHRHADCKYAYTPKSRVEFWENKFQKNIVRDLIVRKQLEQLNIRILIIWECTINNMIKDPAIKNTMLDSVTGFLNSEVMILELYNLRS